MTEKIYPDHDPFCIIYQLGPEHCNCTPFDPDYEPKEILPTDVDLQSNSNTIIFQVTPSPGLNDGPIVKAHWPKN